MIARFLLAAFVIATIIFLIVRIAGSNDSTPVDESTAEPATESVLTLREYADRPSSSVQFIIDGKINAIEDHRQLRFTISQSRRVAEILSGYNGDVLERQTRSNTRESYTALLSALDRLGFDEVGESRYSEADGLCSYGRRMYYRIREGAATLQELWSTSCTRIDGTMAGESARITDTFFEQFPDFREFTKDADINLNNF